MPPPPQGKYASCKNLLSFFPPDHGIMWLSQAKAYYKTKTKNLFTHIYQLLENLAGGVFYREEEEEWHRTRLYSLVNRNFGPTLPYLLLPTPPSKRSHDYYLCEWCQSDALLV